MLASAGLAISQNWQAHVTIFCRLDNTMTTVEDKIQNACFQLNHDAYVLQSKNKKHLRQFTPCQKSLVLLDCLREGTHFGTAMMTASLTWCPCHNGLSEDNLYALCFDSTARNKHYGQQERN